MLNKLIALKRIIDENPKTPMLWWAKETGLNREEITYLRDNNHLNKIGDKKGTKWFWRGDEPNYEFADLLISRLERPRPKTVRVNNVNVTNQTTMLDVISSYNIEFKLGNGLTLKFINENEVNIRRTNGNNINITDPGKLNEMLCFLI